MNDALNVRFAGPVTPYTGGLAAELARLGYPKSTARGHLEMWAHLSRWLANEQLPLSELTESEITRFLAVRRATRASLYSAAALAPGLEYLRRSDVVPRFAGAVAVTPVEVLLDQFRGYLQVERGLLEATAETYAYRVRPFLQRRVHGGVLELTSLNAADVSGFCSAALPALQVESVKSTITALRALLRFLHVEGITAAPLSAAVPKVASWRLTGLPSGLTSATLSPHASHWGRRHNAESARTRVFGVPPLAPSTRVRSRSTVPKVSVCCRRRRPSHRPARRSCGGRANPCRSARSGADRRG
jgi:integrase/recombinase XerD